LIRRRKRPKRQRSRFYRINFAISANELRVLDENNKQIGILSKEDALAKAKEKNVDLVEIAPKARPPVARLIEFSKFKYLENKKKQAEKKKQKRVETKEIRLSPVIGQHDFEVRAQQACDFLNDGNPLKISIQFRGRMITRKQFGYDVLKRFYERLNPIKIVREAKFEGRTLVSHVVRNKEVKDTKHESKNKKSS